MKWIKITTLIVLFSMVFVMPASADPTIEIISNGHFNVNTGGWSVGPQGGLMTYDAGLGYDAAGSMCINPDGDDSGGVVYQCYNLTTVDPWPSTGWPTVEVEGWYYSTNVVTVTYGASFYSVWNCDDGDFINNISGVDNPATSGQWTFFSSPIGFPINARAIKIHYAVGTPHADPGAVVCFDDVKAFSATTTDVSVTGITANSNVLLLAGLGLGGLVASLRLLKRRQK